MLKICSAKKIACIFLLPLAASMMSACVSYHGEDLFAEDTCSIIRQMARAEFLDREGNAARSDDSNDVLGAIFQSDENKEKLGRKQHYTEKC